MKTDLRLTNLPKLENIDVYKEDVSMENTNVFNNISSFALSLQALSINISRPVKSVKLDSIPELPNLRTLRLAIGGSRYDCLLYLASILRACPNLVNFTIRPLWTSPLIDRREKRDVINNLNVNLKFFGIEGYYGRKCDLELAKYIIQTVVALKKIVIYDPYVWCFHLPSPAAYKFLCNRETARSTTTRQLKPILPNGVELCILV
ncbi:F-box domain containing protein [Tanacetum coccineum]